MRTPPVTASTAAFVLALLLAPVDPAAAAAALDFNRDVRPILSDNCFACHGFDAKKRKAGLRLDTPEGALAVNEDGVAAVKPGAPDASGIIQRILSTNPDEVMPPPDSHKQITAAQLVTLKRWIQEGAEYRGHWSFEPPVKPPVPMIASAAAPVRNSIDAFIQQRLAAEGIAPSAEASREALIRRLTLDLTGLPPTVEEVDSFLSDSAPDAYERLVERMLNSPRYGEHMGRHWLDVARYADTHGLHLDNERSMWPYRDWVVRAFNENLPFDQFTIWQLAGDLIPGATVDQQVASGFNRCNVTTSEGGSINEEFIFRYAVDRTETAVSAWMGLTAGCAVCHDHKFDPISQKEFYGLYAFFNSAADPAMDGNILLTPPILRLSTGEQKKQLADYDARIAQVDEAIRAEVQKLGYADPASLQPPPPVQVQEDVWFEDAFPKGAKPEQAGAKAAFVSREQGPVFSGERSLKRSAAGLEQDFFSGGARFVVPLNGRLSVQCYADPMDPPKAVMVQFHTDGWKHRALWGDEAAIPFGTPKTPEKVVMGALPKAGTWVKLEVQAERMGLKPGDIVTGYAFTQYGGTVHWDHLAMTSRVDPARDSAWSYKIWVEKNQGRRVEGLPNDLQTLVRGKKAPEWPPADAGRVHDWWLQNVYQGAKAVLDPWRQKKAPLEAAKKKLEDAVPATFVMADLPKPRDSFVMERGQYDKPGEKVARGTPAAFPALRATGEPTRLDLARWLMAPEHPLTARVAVNRLWQQFFGVGLVKTSSDFGSQGEAPSHPELLDWLAVSFREGGWNVKELVRLMVASHAYRQSSAFTMDSAARDPENRLLARAARFRLDAEVVRDQALLIGGLLSPKIGGKGVRPYQPENIWEPVAFGGSNTRYYKQEGGENLYRRSLYTFWKRTAPPPGMTTFDAPNRESSCSRRERSNTPLQALNLMNDVQYFEAARTFAERILSHGGTNDDHRVTHAFRMVTSRRPSAAEAEVVLAALRQHRAAFQAKPEAAQEVIRHGESAPGAGFEPVELAAWTMVANLLLNLDEAVTR